MRHSYKGGYQAHLLDRKGEHVDETVLVPDTVYHNQRGWDGRTFRAYADYGRQPVVVRLVGDDYGLWSPGTGAMCVRLVRRAHGARGRRVGVVAPAR